MMLQIGDQFDHFTISAHLARGGMSDIYLARDLLSGKDVVLKIPSESLAGDPAQAERFKRELEVMQMLNHPAIQKGVGSGEYNRTPYLVTEWIDGKPMRDIVTEEAPMPLEKALDLIRRIADGIAYCHENDVVHRDLKPDNILITPEGQPVILDFGMVLTKGGRRVTYANLNLSAGTPDYMAPEQIEGQRGDQHTDQYALATMFYELVAGRVPYSGDTNMAVMSQHLNAPLPRLDKAVPGVSPQVAAVVAKGLAKNPVDRYPTVKDFVTALESPQSADLSLLAASADPGPPVPFYKTQAFVAVAASLAILAAIILLAVLLQSARVAP